MFDSAAYLSGIKLNGEVTYSTQPFCFVIRSAPQVTTGLPMTAVAVARVGGGSRAVNWTTPDPCSVTVGPASQAAAARSKVRRKDISFCRKYDCEVDSTVVMLGLMVGPAPTALVPRYASSPMY